MTTHSLWRMLEGKVVNKQYHLKKLLGSSCFGGVFMADEVIKNRPIRRLCIKLIISDDTEAQAEELFSVASLQHPHLVNYYSCGECLLNASHFLYVAMELADSSLESYLHSKKVTPSDTIDIVKHIASALEFLQTEPHFLVHRQIKPTNILRFKNIWKLADFGLVKLREDENDFNKTTQILGTPIYAPPEAYEGVISPAWDRWSLGVVIYQALTGKSPFEAKTSYQLTQKILTTEPDYSKLPSNFRDLVKGCLTKNYGQRWSAKQILGRLPEQEKTTTVNDYLAEGNELYEQDKYEEAIEKYTQAIRANPHFSDAYNNRGVVLYVIEDLDGALKDYTQVIRLNPHFADAYNNRGVVRYDLEDYQGAIKDYTQAIDLNPNFADAYFNRGVAKYELKDYQGAIEDYTEAINLNPHFADAYYERGNAYSYLGDSQKAKKDYNKAILINPNYIEEKEELDWGEVTDDGE